MNRKAIVLAHYLPQFHPIPENDVWWGKGFTEWTNTAKAKPLFCGHIQPNLPADLGFYDLRVPEVREQQAELARKHGITGFAYWHYWFGNGLRILERPFDEVLQSGRPDFPFCLAWANESWTGVWHGLKDQILMEQTYPGEPDHILHFNHLLAAFQDKRYIKIGNKPVFILYLPQFLPETAKFTKLWNELAVQNGFDGMYFIGIYTMDWDHKYEGFDEKSVHPLHQYMAMFEASSLRRKKNDLVNFCLRRLKTTYTYSDLIKNYNFSWLGQHDFIPTILPNWDNTPRSGKNGYVIHRSSPALFGEHFKSVVQFVMQQATNKNNIILLKSWNEWAEGNYIEPDSQWGSGYLEAIQEALQELGVDSTYKSRKISDFCFFAFVITYGMNTFLKSLRTKSLKVLLPGGFYFSHEGYCPCCDREVTFTAYDSWLRDSFRCSNCSSVPRERALIWILERYYPNWREFDIHESSPSQSGASLKLKKNAKRYIASQYFPDKPFGSEIDSFQNQDLEHQTFADESFDLVVTQDVMEHLYDPGKAFAEIARTLKKGGAHVFTVPIINRHKPTEIWAVKGADDGPKFLKSQEWHQNPVDPHGSPVTMHWGFDIADFIKEHSGLPTNIEYIDNLDFGIRAELIEVLVSQKPG